MGKSKKTRWRALDLDSGSQDETQTNDVDVKFNENSSDPSGSAANKYSQILGDHHNSNNSTSLNGRNPLSSSFSTYKSRSYNNKENYYNQRIGGRSNGGGQKSWQRSGSYRATFSNGKDSNKKQEENEKAGTKDANDSSTEPKRFNEDEYTRITTPRQDVLFKKGYLSRNINKTATTNTSLSTTSTTANSTDTTAANSSATTSDPDSSVNSLSPATTPSMEFGGGGGLQDDYGQPFYHYSNYGCYDESGMFVIPAMYNGYYQSPHVSPGSPMIFMPYPPYPYDPFFMPPNEMTPTDGENENSDEKEETETTVEVEGDEKDSNEQKIDDESNNNGASPVSSTSPLSLDGDKCSNNQEDDGEGGDEAEEEDEDVKKKCDEQLDINGFDENQAQNFVENDDLSKQDYPFYQNYNNYIYPNMPANYYNGYYFFNGQAQRPSKMKRRKRFPSSRNQSRSTETTTDDENTTQHKFNYKYQGNGWMPHARSYFRDDQNHAGFTLNVNVEEFHPRNQMQDTPQIKVDESNNVKSKIVSQESSKVAKASQATAKNARVTKREIIQGIKSMEQQNIDLMATKHTLMTNANQDVEWNVIKKGKKVKVVRDNEESSQSKSSPVIVAVSTVKCDEPAVTKNEEPIVKSTVVMSTQQENATKKSSKVVASSKKTKNKGKKKKPHLMVKQDGFEIIEPEFTKPSIESRGEEEIEPETSNDESEEIFDENEVLRNNDKSDECIKQEIAVEKSDESVVVAASVDVVTNDEIKLVEEILQQSKNVNDLTKAQDIEEVDTVIDISDDDIRSSKALITELLRIPSVDVDEDKTVVLPQQEVKEIIYKKETIKSPEVQYTPSTPQPPIQKSVEVVEAPTKPVDTFQDSDFFNDRSNIADLERDLIENLRQLDEDIDFKSPIINPLYDFPITSAVQKWLQAKQNESFENLFHVQNLQKLCEIYSDVNDEVDDDDEETESDISEKEMKSETDSDYASDFHAKTSGNSPTCSNHAKASANRSKLIASKESFCALM